MRTTKTWFASSVKEELSVNIEPWSWTPLSTFGLNWNGCCATGFLTWQLCPTNLLKYLWPNSVPNNPFMFCRTFFVIECAYLWHFTSTFYSQITLLTVLRRKKKCIRYLQGGQCASPDSSDGSAVDSPSSPIHHFTHLTSSLNCPFSFPNASNLHAQTRNHPCPQLSVLTHSQYSSGERKIRPQSTHL